MTRSAALGGLFIGVLSALPIVGWANCCCCLWIVSGGALSAYLEIQQTNRSLTTGEGAAVGSLAAVIGAFVRLPFSVAGMLLLNAVGVFNNFDFPQDARDLPPEVRQVMAMFAGWAGVGLTFMMHLVIGPIFGAIGGMLAAAYYKKEVPPALGGTWVPPLPPQ